MIVLIFEVILIFIVISILEIIFLFEVIFFFDAFFSFEVILRFQGFPHLLGDLDIYLIIILSFLGGELMNSNALG